MTPTLNNGIFLRESKMAVNSNLTEEHLMNLVKKPGPTDLGVWELWMQTKTVDTPLYSLASFDAKNIVNVDDIDGRYSWKHPIQTDLPFMLEDLDPSNTTKGLGGFPFQIKVNKPCFYPTDIITYDKMNGLELYIISRDAYSANYAIYTVELIDKTAVFDNEFLKPVHKWFRSTSSKDEFGQEYSGLYQEAGHREFFNYVSTARANAGYNVSSRAELIMKKGLNADNTVPITQIWKIDDKNLDPSVRSIEQYKALLGPEGFRKAMENGTVTRSFVTNLEKASLNKIMTDIESYMMWGKGGLITGSPDSPKQMRLSVGLWKQTDTSFKKIFNIEDFNIDMFESELYNYYNGRIDFTGPDSKNELIVQTGVAGMKLINNAIEAKALRSTARYEVASDRLGIIEGSSAMELSYGMSFTRFKIPFLANVKFVCNPALDPTDGVNDIENPLINGFRLSSYSFLIHDIDSVKNGNIMMLQDAFDNQLHWSQQIGNMDRFGNSQGVDSSGNFDGYRMKFEMRHKTLVLKDPTQVLKFVARNPITGFSL